MYYGTREIGVLTHSGEVTPGQAVVGDAGCAAKV
jgi:hypothetical protein